MVTSSLRALLSEPRPAQPPVRVWRDWALLGVAVAASLIEAALRPDRTWLLTALAVSIVVALCVLWRRTHPLPAVAVAFGMLIVFPTWHGSSRAMRPDCRASRSPSCCPTRCSVGRRAVRPPSGSGSSWCGWVSPMSQIRPRWARWWPRMGSSCSQPRLGPPSASAPPPACGTSSRPSSGSATSLLATCTTPSVTTCRASSSRPRRDGPWRPPTPIVRWPCSKPSSKQRPGRWRRCAQSSVSCAWNRAGPRPAARPA